MHIEGLDEADNRILDVISENARLTYSEIGERIGMSRVAVKLRMKQMEENGVIRGYRTIVEPKRVPESIQFFLDIEADPEQLNDVLNYLGKDPMIRQLYLVTGSCRIHAIGLAVNQATMQVHTNLLYRNCKGVKKMVCSLILNTLKDLDGGIDYEGDSDEKYRTGNPFMQRPEE